MKLKLAQEALMAYINTKDEQVSAADNREDYADAVAVDSANRLRVYRNGYRVRLSNVLQQAYPALSRLLGASPFNSLVQDYLGAHPPSGVSVVSVGEHLPAFLRVHLGQGDAVVELAQFEWDVYSLALQEDVPVLTVDLWKKYVQNDPESYCFSLRNTVRVLRHEYNTLAVWEALCNRRSAPEVSVNLNSVLLWRDAQYTVLAEPISAMSVRLLRLLDNGVTLAQCCEVISTEYADEVEAVEGISAQLLQWIEKGLFAQ